MSSPPTEEARGSLAAGAPTTGPDSVRKNHVACLARHSDWLTGGGVVAFLVVALLLTVRTVYTSVDDDNYVAYFAGQVEPVMDTWLALLLEEPVWRALAAALGALMGAEGALRFTIFAATTGFLVASSRLAKGAWAFVLAAFLLDQSMATLFYFIQLRTGLALALFLGVMAAGGGAVVASITAAAIHASFLAAIPCALLAMVARRSRAVFGLTLVLVALVVALTGSLIELLDLGRRTATYEATGTSNFNFYFIAFVQYAIVAWVVWPNYSDKQVGDQFRMNSIFFVLAIGLSFFHETAVRLVFMSHALSVTNLGACASTRRGRWGMGTWVVLLVLLIAVETARSGNDPDAWIRRWGAILFG